MGVTVTSDLVWAVAVLSWFPTTIYLFFRRPDVWCRGRLITQPLARYLMLPPRQVRDIYWGVGGLTYLSFLAVGLVLTADAYWQFLHVVWVGIYWSPVLDDLLTGSRDRWRKRLARARNRVRWRMKLPALAPSGGPR